MKPRRGRASGGRPASGADTSSAATPADGASAATSPAAARAPSRPAVKAPDSARPTLDGRPARTQADPTAAVAPQARHARQGSPAPLIDPSDRPARPASTSCEWRDRQTTRPRTTSASTTKVEANHRACCNRLPRGATSELAIPPHFCYARARELNVRRTAIPADGNPRRQYLADEPLMLCELPVLYYAVTTTMPARPYARVREPDPSVNPPKIDARIEFAHPACLPSVRLALFLCYRAIAEPSTKRDVGALAAARGCPSRADANLRRPAFRDRSKRTWEGGCRAVFWALGYEAKRPRLEVIEARADASFLPRSHGCREGEGERPPALALSCPYFVILSR
jgi:hypothetical protein